MLRAQKGHKSVRVVFIDVAVYFCVIFVEKVTSFCGYLPKTPNNMQQGVQTDVTCLELLANNVASVCSGL